jgi:hypothetical protein
MDLVIDYFREFNLQNRTMAIKTIAMTNRTVIGDNNAWNNTHIARQTGKEKIIKNSNCRNGN